MFFCFLCLFLFFVLLLFLFCWLCPKTTKMRNAEKTDILTRTVSTGVFTNNVFCVSFNFASFAENTIRIGVSAKKQKMLKLKTGPS